MLLILTATAWLQFDIDFAFVRLNCFHGLKHNIFCAESAVKLQPTKRNVFYSIAVCDSHWKRHACSQPWRTKNGCRKLISEQWIWASHSRRRLRRSCKRKWMRYKRIRRQRSRLYLTASVYMFVLCILFNIAF